MPKKLLQQEPRIKPPLYPEFVPVSLGDAAYKEAVEIAAEDWPVSVAYEREDGLVAVDMFRVLDTNHPNADETLEYVVDRVSSGLVNNGARTLFFSGPQSVCRELRERFSPSGTHKWVGELQRKAYGKFEIIKLNYGETPKPKESSVSLGGSFNGARIGFDLGASDAKVVAVNNGVPVFCKVFKDFKSKNHKDPRYHLGFILYAIAQAAEALPNGKVDAIGGSSSGVWVDNHMKIGNLASAVGIENFNRYLVNGVSSYWQGTPLVIMHDGHVAAVEGKILIPEARGLLSGAMGSHYGAGYVDLQGRTISKLFEHAFVRVDRYEKAPMCGVMSGLQGIAGEYLCQRGVENMRQRSGMALEEIKADEKTPLEDRLVVIRELAEKGDQRAINIFDSIGVIFGYSIPTFIDLCGQTDHVLAVGRVVKGPMGDLIVQRAEQVLKAGEFGDRYQNVRVVNTEAQSFQEIINQRVGGGTVKNSIDSFAEVGQAWAAASLPYVK